MTNEKRLIDANALMNAIDEYMKKVYDCQLSEIEEYQSCSNDTKCIYIVQGLYEAVEICEETPTVDAVEVVHGQWIWSEENECWVCSRCGMSALNDYRGNSAASDYCPKCGAKMDGGNEDG